LIYSRFFTKYLRDLGLTKIDEPFPHYLAQGMVTKDGSAMSKSRGNVVDPDEMVKTYGADALRILFFLPLHPKKNLPGQRKGSKVAIALFLESGIWWKKIWISSRERNTDRRTI